MLAWLGQVQYSNLNTSSIKLNQPYQPESDHTIQPGWHGMARLLIRQCIKNGLATKGMVNITMGTPFNWTREETIILISLWSKDVIQQQLEGCSRNILAYRNIANDLWEAGYSGSLEQCRDKIKKLKGEYKVCDDR